MHCKTINSIVILSIDFLEVNNCGLKCCCKESSKSFKRKMSLSVKKIHTCIILKQFLSIDVPVERIESQVNSVVFSDGSKLLIESLLMDLSLEAYYFVQAIKIIIIRICGQISRKKL